MRRLPRAICFIAAHLACAGLLLPAITFAGPVTQPSSGAETIRVDLRDAPRGLFHADLQIAVKPGPVALVYPRWIPGDHLPAGPIENLAGLRFTANGKPVAWERDRFEADVFHLVVPAGVTVLDAHLDFLATPSLITAINQSSNATTDTLAVLRWHVVTLYPQGAAALTHRIRPSVILPRGWSYATAMTGTREADGAISFPETTLERLIDSPLTTGQHMQSYPIASLGGAPVTAAVLADEPANLVLTPNQVKDLRGMVEQSYAMFGSRPFDHYDFLVTLSDVLRKDPSIGGQEHMESSDDVGGARTFRDPAGRETVGNTMAHEFAHVWNGKYRRPIGEATRNYQQPYDNGLLWVYEGLTTYLGGVLAARGGAFTPTEFRDELANDAAAMANRGGRQWRSLLDTAIGLPATMRARSTWGDWRRGADYYPEGALLWLDVDLTIRRLSGDTKSLDDFSRLFFAKTARDPKIKPYDMRELVATLNRVAPNDWQTFFHDRLERPDTHLPTDVFAQSGWTLGYVPTPNPFEAVNEAGGALDLTYSLGMTIDGSGKIGSVGHDTPADVAGLAPGQTLMGVNGDTYSSAHLRAALEAARSGTDPIVLLVSGTSTVRSVSIAYHGGAKYPALIRDEAMPDRLSAIAKPLAVDTKP